MLYSFLVVGFWGLRLKEGEAVEMQIMEDR
jgi:hypothetical protein